MLMPRWFAGLMVASIAAVLVASVLIPVEASAGLPPAQASVGPDTGTGKDPCPVPAQGKLRSDAECDLLIRLINNSSTVSTFSISQSGVVDAFDESLFSPALPGYSKLGQCPCAVTVAGNSAATYGLRVEVNDVTPGWYTSRISVHLLHTGGRLLHSFQLKIEEVSPDWDVTVSRDSVSLDEADDPGTAGAWEHQATYSVRLTEEPSNDVTVTPVSADTSVVTVSQALTFTAANWQTDQTVTITAVDDDIDNVGDRHASIRHDVSGVGSGDVMVDDVAVVVADDDARGVSVSAGSLMLDEADDPDTDGVLEHRGTYTVQLASEPAGGDVTIDLASGDTSVATVSPATLSFTSADWSTAQTVTVDAVDDHVNTASGRQTSIAHTVTSAGDYAGVTAADVSVTVDPRIDPCPPAAGGDYDIDDDGLIEVCNLAQLNAIRWDLNGDGVADVYPPDKHGFTGHDPNGATKLAAAFPNAAVAMGCPTGGCEGYELSADLDFDTNANGRADAGDDYWNDGLGWHPLIGGARLNSARSLYPLRDTVSVDGTSVCCGDRPHPRARMFTAEFEGNGRTIANLYINDDLGYVGLFGIIGPGGDVRNVGLTAPNADSGVTGRWYVGALTGDIERGRVSGVYSDLDVSGQHQVGGLTGSIWNYGSMIESYATGDVTGSQIVGGLLGSVSRSGVSAVYATGDVTVTIEMGGGLVGFGGYGHIQAAYATGSVTAGPKFYPLQRIGGLVGESAHSWTESGMRANYATGRVTTPNDEVGAGGLTGACRRSERERSEGANYWNVKAANYWDVETAGMVHSTGCGLGFTTAQLQAPTGYTGIYENWDVDEDVGSSYASFLGPDDDPWDFGTSTQYPVLKYCAEKPGIETPDGQPYCPLQPDDQRDPSSGQVGTVSSPVVNVAAATNISEGQTAAFIIAGNPNPSADLPVNISVTAGGDYGVTAETKTVTVPADGSYTLSVATTNDNVDEDDGTVTVTINTGTGYAVSETSGAARVTIEDDDVPKISIAAVDADISEGVVAEFALTAVPVPASPLSVNVSVAQSGEFGVSTGSRQVTIGTSGTATLSVSTSGDRVDEVDGSVTATVVGGSGYSVSSSARSASVAVRDNDHDDSCVVALWGDGSVSGRWAHSRAGWVIVPSPGDDSFSAWWAASCSSAARAGRFARFFTFSLDSSSQVTIDLESPHGHTTYLHLRAGLGQRSGEALASDDNRGDRDNTRIRHQLAAGDYTIEATTHRPQVAAPFTLTVAGIPKQTAAQAKPEVSITAGGGVTEGDDAIFTVTADPAPSAALGVAVAVTAAGDFGVSPGSRTVTVPTSGSVTLTVATVGDSVDEADGSVTAAVSVGSGYTVSSSAGTASVAVDDDDDPVPVGDRCVAALSGDGSVSGVWAAGCGSAARAGRFARFYSFSLDSSSRVTVDLVSSADTYLYLRRGVGQKSGAALAFNDDGGDGYNSRISRSLAAGGYTIEATTYRASTSGAFTLTVDGIGALTVVRPDPVVSITAGGGVTEGGDAVFTVTADPVPSAALDVTVAVAGSGDFGVSPGSQTVTIPTSGSATLTVATTNDSTDETDGSVTATINTGTGYTVSATASAATVAIADDDDPVPVDDNDDDPPCDAATAISRARAAFAWHTDNNGGSETLFWQILAYLGADPMPAPPGGATPAATTPEAVKTFSNGKPWPGWAPINEALAACEPPTNTQHPTDQTPPPPPPPDPEISVAAGAGITEGGDAAFTITADPAPAAPLTITVTVTPTGDYGATPGSHTVTVPASGTATLTIATTNDTTDEPNGSVTATINTGTGYTVSTTSGAATMAIADDDNPPPPPPPPPPDPEVSITAGSGVTEGGDATFTITADPAPSAALTVTVAITQTGDFGAATGTRQVTVPTTGTATLTVATTNDSTDEADGSVTATITAGAGYTISTTAAAASVAVADDDNPPPPPPPPSKPSITVGDATAGESDGSVSFTVQMSGPAAGPVTVYYNTYGGTATAHDDYRPEWGQVTLAAGDTSKTAQISVIDDSAGGEGSETFWLRLRLYDTTYATMEDGLAKGTITDND